MANGGALQRPPQLRPPYGAAPAPQPAQGPAQGIPPAQGPSQGLLPARGLRPHGAVVLPALPGVLFARGKVWLNCEDAPFWWRLFFDIMLVGA